MAMEVRGYGVFPNTLSLDSKTTWINMETNDHTNHRGFHIELQTQNNKCKYFILINHIVMSSRLPIRLKYK